MKGKLFMIQYEDITKEKYEKALKIAQECLDWVELTIKEIEKGKKEEG